MLSTAVDERRTGHVVVIAPVGRSGHRARVGAIQELVADQPAIPVEDRLSRDERYALRETGLWLCTGITWLRNAPRRQGRHLPD
jgi:hypothetical protein